MMHQAGYVFFRQHDHTILYHHTDFAIHEIKDLGPEFMSVLEEKVIKRNLTILHIKSFSNLGVIFKPEVCREPPCVFV